MLQQSLNKGGIMREITTVTKVYFFNELNEEQQQKAIDNYRDINTDHKWYDFIFEEAIHYFGIEILKFDLYRGQSIEIEPIETLSSTAIKMKEKLDKNGEVIEYANNYLKSLYNDINQNKTDKDDYQEIFLDELRHYFWNELNEEYEYLTGKEAIKETLIANEYEFTQDGKIF